MDLNMGKEYLRQANAFTQGCFRMTNNKEKQKFFTYQVVTYLLETLLTVTSMELEF